MPSTPQPRAALESSYLRLSANTSLDVVYAGIHPDGRIRVIINGDKALVSGNLYSISVKHPADGSTKKIRRKIHTTDSYQAGGADEVGFLAVAQKTRKRYRIIGCVDYCSPPPSTRLQHLSPRDAVAVANMESAADACDPKTLQQEQHVQSISMATIAPLEPVLQETEQQPIVTISLTCESTGEAPPSPGVDAGTDVCTSVNTEDQVEALRRKKQQQQAERREKAIHREHAAVTAQRLLGLDPLISVTYLSHITGHSISTLYRKFGKALPKPIKAGSRSRVPYSAAEAYITAR